MIDDGEDASNKPGRATAPGYDNFDDETNAIADDLRRKRDAASSRNSGFATGIPLSGDVKTSLAINVSAAATMPGAYRTQLDSNATITKTPASQDQLIEIVSIRNQQKNRLHYQHSGRDLEARQQLDTDEPMDDLQVRMMGFRSEVEHQVALDKLAEDATLKEEQRKHRRSKVLLIGTLCQLVVFGVTIALVLGLGGAGSNVAPEDTGSAPMQLHQHEVLKCSILLLALSH
jgi:hypothetical protein